MIHYKHYLFLSGFVLSFILGSCSNKLQTPAVGETLVVFPQPPDTTRIQFLTSISSSLDISGQRSSFLRYVLGPEPGKPIHKPYGITVKKDKIYICDSMLPGLEIIDLKNQSFDYFMPTGLGQLKKPLNCDLDEQQRIYVADAGRKQVLRFESAATPPRLVGEGILTKPTDVRISGNKIWICDLAAHQIKVFDENTLKFKFAFPDTLQHKPGFLFSPTNIEIIEDKIYVTDTGDARVKAFDLEGNYLSALGGFGKKPGHFVRPKGLTVDRDGLIYIVDAAFENVQIFNAKHRLLMFFGTKTKGPGQMWLPAGIAIDYDNLQYFQQYVYSGFNLQYLIFVTNQYGPARINVYGYVKPK